MTTACPCDSGTCSSGTDTSGSNSVSCTYDYHGYN